MFRSPPRTAPRAPADPAAVRRALAAALRWRCLRVLPATLPGRAALAARLAPILLHASFQHPSLRGEAPGVAGMRYRRSWASLARSFELPPPWRAQRDTPQVDAVLAIPEDAVVTVLVVTVPNITRADLHWVEERASVVQGILSAAGGACALRVLEPAALARDPLLSHRIVLFGALVGGRLSAAAWAAMESAAQRPVDPRDLADLAGEAPAGLPALALALVSGGRAAPPLDVAKRLLQQGTPARRVAAPAVVCTRWAVEAQPRHAAALEAIARLTSPAPDLPPEDAGAVLLIARQLALPLARSIRAARRAGLGPGERARWRERVGADLPRALLPALGARLATGGALETLLHSDGRRHEIRLPGGAVLGRGATPLQARVRALSVLASAALDPLLAHAEPPWRSVAARLALPRIEPTLLLVVEPAGPSGPPYDPLNRGPERNLGFPGGFAIRLAPGRRPSARALTAAELVHRLLDEVAAGTRVEVLASRPEAHPVAARLSQLAALVQERGELPVAVEAAGRALLLGEDGLRSFRLERLAARPRTYLPDPDAPDLALSPGERRPSGLGGASVVECRALPLDARRAVILYSDRAQGHLREVVFLSDLEEHLREARAILQAADPRAVLTVHLADELEAAVRRAGPPSPPIHLAVRAVLPWDVQIQVEGEWYGGRSRRTWRDGALKLLVRWPREMEARLAVSTVTAVARGKRRGGLLALYARSLALRRMRTHLVRTLRAYQKPRARRSGG
ncbi:MAG TPA: hypothetical protein VEB43_05105 [Anaeromyxobacter sp.]|nr:hypothetical protein [Anaeromyxobacter sp.]